MHLNVIFHPQHACVCVFVDDVIERFTIRSSSICVFVILYRVCQREKLVFAEINSFIHKTMIVGFCFYFVYAESPD